MEVWKFLLTGITGDLAKKKILPALAQFAYLNQDKVAIELYGYSRSQANANEILDILNTASVNSHHCLQKVEYIRGEYDNPKIFFEFISSLKEGERFVNYVAIPPLAFLQVLRNACPFSNNLIDIVIEKPFGRDIQEAGTILNVTKSCDLSKKVHFSDHYLFKTAVHLSKADVSNFKIIKEKTIEKISVHALERVDAKNRGGYYDTVGALKDIFIHLFSLLDAAIDIQLQGNNKDYKSFKVLDVQLGQYEGYKEDVNNLNSFTNTYFKVDSELVINGKVLALSFESGKKLNAKSTGVDMIFRDGASLIWDIAPGQNIAVKDDVGQDLVSLNLARDKKLDHTNLFEDILNNRNDKFVDDTNIISSWEIYNKVIDFIIKNKVQVKTYKPYIYPLEWVH